MRRRSKGGKAAKTQRRKTSNASKAARRRGSASKETNIARLTRERDEALQQQVATAEVLKVISRSAFDLQPVLNSIVETASRLCDAEFAIIFKLDGDKYHVAASNNADEAFVNYASKHPIAPGRGSLVGRTALEGKTVHLPDCLADPEYTHVEYQHAGKYRSDLGVPLLREGSPIGVIALMRTEVKPFSDREIELVETFADQAVIAMENARLFEAEQQRTRELSESLEQQTATADVLRVISSSPGELNPVFDAMLANAVRICSASFGILFRFDEGAWRAASMFGLPPAFAEYWQRGPQRPGPRTALGRVAETMRPVHIADVKTEPAYVEGESIFVAAVNLGGFRTILNVPLLKEDELLGALAIYRTDVSPFAEKQIGLLTNFAAQAVIAIENARLLSELRESLQQQMATSEILQVISNSPTDSQPAFDAIVQSGLKLFPDAVVVVSLPEGDMVKAVAIDGANQDDREALRRRYPLPLSREYITGTAILDRREMDFADARETPAQLIPGGQNFLASGYRAITVMPMMRGETSIGAISVVRRQPGPLSDKQRELLRTFANQAVIAIENVRLFESAQARTRELVASLDDLRTAQDRLVHTQKLASLGQLTAGIAHEMKNPLNFVNNFSGVSAELVDELQDTLKGFSFDDEARAQVNELTDALRNNLDKVVHHGKRADAIVKNMLLHSRESSGEHRTVDINALVEESLNLAYHGARAEKQGFEITLQQSFDPSAGEVDIFPQEIRRALLNLISNGFYAATKRRAAANGGDHVPTIAASTKSLGDRVEIRIRDNGTGISPAVKEMMFNPFFTTKPAGEGTGLGLSISHDIIVKQHGGSIEVDTQPGEFTEIRIILLRAAVFLAEPAGRS